MKKRIHLWLGICVALSLLLPYYFVSAGNLTLILPDGNGAGIADQPFDAFFLDSAGNLTVVLPTFPDIRNPNIIWSLSNCNGCILSQDGATVTAGVGKQFSFDVSTSGSLVVQKVYPPAGNLAAIGGSYRFTWSMAQAGSYVAAFLAGASQKVVDIHVLPPVATFIEAFYLNVLSREPTAQELADWVSHLIDHSKTADDLAQATFLSQTGLNLPPDTFVQYLYQVLLGRNPEPGAGIYWISEINATSRAAVLSILIHSQEFANVCNRLGILPYSATPRYQLTVNVNPAGAGSVSLNPSGGSYDANTYVDLTPTPAAGYTFSSWSGNAAGDTQSGNTLRVYMNANRTITANFVQSSSGQYTLSVSVNPAGSGSVNPPGGTFAANSIVDLTPTAASGYAFSTWSGNGAGDTQSGNVLRVYMNTNRAVTANFSAGSVPPPTTGERWEWGTYPMFWVTAGAEKVYAVTIDADYMFLRAGVSGLNPGTMGEIDWCFPNDPSCSAPYPQNPSQGVDDIIDMNGSASVVLYGTAYPYGSNISYPYIPRGTHLLKIKAQTPNSYFKAFIEAY